jgi:hypothetical protein
MGCRRGQNVREMFSRWPRYFNHGPPAEIWSVAIKKPNSEKKKHNVRIDHLLHLPLTLIKTGRSLASLPSHFSKGLRSWRRSLEGLTRTWTEKRSSGGGWKVSCPGSYPRGGSSWPEGGENLNGVPEGVGSESVRGLKESEPAKERAVTISGEATKAWVAGLASLRPVKLRLYEVTTRGRLAFLSFYEKKKGEDIRTSIGLALLDVLPVPLTDARTASVGENDATNIFESLDLAITFNGGANLLGTGGDSVCRLELETSVLGLCDEGSGAGHVLVGRVGAGTDEGDLDLIWPVVLLGFGGELGDGGGEIGSERTVDMGLEFGKVDFDDLVVFGVLVGGKVVSKLLGVIGDHGAVGGIEIVGHAVVEGEEGGGGADFSAHVADGSHASATEGFDTRAGVLDDGTCSALDGENAGDLEDDVLGGRPATNFPDEIDTNDLWALELPRKTSHDVNGISTSDAAGNHTEATGVGGVRVSADHETTGEGIVFEDDLVDDTGARFPEAEAVFGGSGSQKVVDFLVDVDSALKILDTTDLSLDQVVAVDGRGDGGGIHTG